MKQLNSTDYGLIIALFLLALGIISIFIPFNIFDGLNLGKFVIHIGKYNELGDFINGVTTPFISIAAFILLYITYNSQKNELKLTRKTLERQNELINKQQFESTFFNLLNLHNQIVNDIDTDSIRRTQNNRVSTEERIVSKGRDCFMKFFELFRYYHVQISKTHLPIIAIKDRLVFIDKVYYDFNLETQSDLGHYFRNLYSIIKFVDDSNVANKKDYTNLIRAQLSIGELLLLYYYCLSRYGLENFKPLIEKYSLLNSLTNVEEIIRYNYNDLYESTAFD